MPIQFETYELPASWAPYLINNDPSGYSDLEIVEMDRFVKGKGCCQGCSDDDWFQNSNDAFTLACNVKEYYFPKKEG